jgi:hypothetical protein
MVRLIPVERNGRIVWLEDAPTRCGAGHEDLVPTYSGCPACHEPVRLWKCRTPGCGEVLVDDEHVHYSRR